MKEHGMALDYLVPKSERVCRRAFHQQTVVAEQIPYAEYEFCLEYIKQLYLLSLSLLLLLLLYKPASFSFLLPSLSLHYVFNYDVLKH
jgi:hypothetical protein